MNSPRVTTVVGTSATDCPPKTPRTPATAATMPIAAIEPRIARLLLRHMTLDLHSRLQAGRDDRLDVVRGAERDGTAADCAPVKRSHRKRIVLACDGISWDDDDVVAPIELHIDCRGEIGQELWMAAANTDDGDEVAHSRREHTCGANRCDLLDTALKVQFRIRIQRNRRRLAHMQ